MYLLTYHYIFFLVPVYSGSYVEHLRQWWKMKDHPNIHTVFYENLRNNTLEEFEKLSKFLSLNLSPKQLENVRICYSNGKKFESVIHI